MNHQQGGQQRQRQPGRRRQSGGTLGNNYPLDRLDLTVWQRPSTLYNRRKKQFGLLHYGKRRACPNRPIRPAKQYRRYKGIGERRRQGHRRGHSKDTYQQGGLNNNQPSPEQRTRPGTCALRTTRASKALRQPQTQTERVK